MNWKSFSPNSWKRSTLKTIISRAYLICSTTNYLQTELDYISHVFESHNNFPRWVVKQILEQEKLKHQNINQITPVVNENNNDKSHLLVLPYAGPKGEKLITSMKKTLKKNLPENVVPKAAFSASRLSDKFNIKTKTKKDHQHDVTYYVQCPEETCNDDYTGETGRRMAERVIDHCGRDKKSHVFKHSVEKDHRLPSIEEYTILGGNYKNNTFRRKVSESLYIKEKRSTLNTHEKSVELKLFN